MTRCLTGHVTINGVDDGWFFSNEYAQVEQSVNLFLDPGTPPVALPVQPLPWGGDCLVELDLNVHIREGNQVHVLGEARLYEVFSTDIRCLEDKVPVEFVVPRNIKGITPTQKSVQLVRGCWEDGDYAEVLMVFTNSIVEE